MEKLSPREGFPQAGIDMSLYVVEQLLGKEALTLTLEEMEWQWHQ
jgi:hypothetical protein